MLFDCHPKILHKHCFQFLMGVKMAPRETENNAYAILWGDKQKALWYAMAFSGVVNWEKNFVAWYKFSFTLWRKRDSKSPQKREVGTSRCHGSKISGWKQTENITYKVNP